MTDAAGSKINTKRLSNREFRDILEALPEPTYLEVNYLGVVNEGSPNFSLRPTSRLEMVAKYPMAMIIKDPTKEKVLAIHAQEYDPRSFNLASGLCYPFVLTCASFNEERPGVAKVELDSYNVKATYSGREPNFVRKVREVVERLAIPMMVSCDQPVGEME